MQNVNNLARILAILMVEQESYSYVDKMSNAPSKELALFYVREALRDFNSLLKKDKFENQTAKEAIKYVSFEKIEQQIEELSQIDDRKKLKEVVSLIGAKALAMAARFKLREMEGQSNE